MALVLETRWEKVFNVFNIFLMGFVALVIFYPFYYMIIYSLNVGEASKVGLYLWPTEFTLENYSTLFDNEYIMNSYCITVLRTVSGTAMHVLFTGFVAYGLADRSLLCRKYYTILFIIPMFFSGGLVPTYLLIIKLGLNNRFWVYLIPKMFGIWNMILMRTYFQSLPASLEESARIDGATDFRIFFQVIIPISAPVIAAITLFSAVDQWNSWFDAFIYVNNPRLHPIQLFLKSVIQQNVGIKNLMNSMAEQGLDAQALQRLEDIRLTTESLKAAATVLTIGPIIVVYPFLQKYFVKGIMIGALKG